MSEVNDMKQKADVKQLWRVFPLSRTRKKFYVLQSVWCSVVLKGQMLFFLHRISSQVLPL